MRAGCVSVCGVGCPCSSAPACVSSMCSIVPGRSGCGCGSQVSYESLPLLPIDRQYRRDGGWKTPAFYILSVVWAATRLSLVEECLASHLQSGRGTDTSLLCQYFLLCDFHPILSPPHHHLLPPGFVRFTVSSSLQPSSECVHCLEVSGKAGGRNRAGGLGP